MGTSISNKIKKSKVYSNKSSITAVSANVATVPNIAVPISLLSTDIVDFFGDRIVTRLFFLFVIVYLSFSFVKKDRTSSPKSIYHIKPFIDVGYNGLMGRILRQFASFVSLFSIILYQTDKELTKLSMFEVLYNVNGRNIKI